MDCTFIVKIWNYTFSQGCTFFSKKIASSFFKKSSLANFTSQNMGKHFCYFFTLNLIFIWVRGKKHKNLHFSTTVKFVNIEICHQINSFVEPLNDQFFQWKNGLNFFIGFWLVYLFIGFQLRSTISLPNKNICKYFFYNWDS